MINLSELIAAIREVAKENPDFVYQGKCQYTPSKENPLGCIVGAGLTKLGFDCSTLVQYKTFRLLVDEGSLIVNHEISLCCVAIRKEVACFLGEGRCSEMGSHPEAW